VDAPHVGAKTRFALLAGHDDSVQMRPAHRSAATERPSPFGNPAARAKKKAGL